MAGDWIALTHSLCDKPEVRRIARKTGVSIDEAVGKLHRFWCWLDVNSVDGRVDGVVSTDVDDIVRLNGFSDALGESDWASFDDDLEVLTVPNFANYNGETAKKRMQKNKRQSKWRNKNNDLDNKKGVDAPPSTSASTKTSTREEKRREELKEGFPTLDVDKWLEWESYRRKKKIKAYATDQQVKKISSLDLKTQALVIDHSLENEYQGLFPEKFESKKSDGFKSMSDGELVKAFESKGWASAGLNRYQMVDKLEASQ